MITNGCEPASWEIYMCLYVCVPYNERERERERERDRESSVNINFMYDYETWYNVVQ